MIYENPRTCLSGGFSLFRWQAGPRQGYRERDSVKPPGQVILWRFRRFPEYPENFVSECLPHGLLGSVQVRRPAKGRRVEANVCIMPITQCIQTGKFLLPGTACGLPRSDSNPLFSPSVLRSDCAMPITGKEACEHQSRYLHGHSHCFWHEPGEFDSEFPARLDVDFRGMPLTRGDAVMSYPRLSVHAQSNPRYQQQ